MLTSSVGQLTKDIEDTMTIDNHCGRDEEGSDFPGSQAEAHALIALEQSALYAARLAIARWMTPLLMTPPTAQRAHGDS